MCQKYQIDDDDDDDDCGNDNDSGGDDVGEGGGGGGDNSGTISRSVLHLFTHWLKSLMVSSSQQNYTNNIKK